MSTRTAATAAQAHTRRDGAESPSALADLARQAVLELQGGEVGPRSRGAQLVSVLRRRVLDWIGSGDRQALRELAEGLDRVAIEAGYGDPYRGLDPAQIFVVRLFGVAGIADAYCETTNAAALKAPLLGSRNRKRVQLLRFVAESEVPVTVDRASEAEIWTSKRARSTADEAFKALADEGLVALVQGTPAAYQITQSGVAALSLYGPPSEEDLLDRVRPGRLWSDRVQALQSLADDYESSLVQGLQLLTDEEPPSESASDEVTGVVASLDDGGAAAELMRWVFDEGERLPRWIARAVERATQTSALAPAVSVMFNPHTQVSAADFVRVLCAEVEEGLVHTALSMLVMHFEKRHERRISSLLAIEAPVRSALLASGSDLPAEPKRPHLVRYCEPQGSPVQYRPGGAGSGYTITDVQVAEVCPLVEGFEDRAIERWFDVTGAGAREGVARFSTSNAV